MTVTLMFSSLASRFKRSEFSEFAHSCPNPWIIWEPGPWLPSSRGDTLHMPATPLPKRDGKPAGEALAMELKPNARRSHLTLGRDPEADLHINDATLSRTHLVFMPQAEGGWTVRDAGSSNGSWIDGQPLAVGHDNPMSDGAHIQAGQVYLTYAEPESLFLRVRQINALVTASK